MPFTKTAPLALALCLVAAPIAPLAADDHKDTQLTEKAPAAPPVAEKREHSYTHHGITISDPYHWLKDQSYPTIDDEDVLDYVKAENAWFEHKMAGQKALTDELFEEMKGRIKEDDGVIGSGIIDPSLELGFAGHSSCGVVGEAQIDQVNFLARRIGGEVIVGADGNVDESLIFATIVGRPRVTGHDVGVDIDGVNRIGYGDRIIAAKNIKNISGIAF